MDIQGDVTLARAIIFLTTWRHIFALDDWEISVATTHFGEEKAAEVQANFTYKRALITVADDIDPDYLPHALIHELLHIRLGMIREMAKTMLKDDKRLTYERDYLLLFEEERTVEVMTNIIERLLKGGGDDGSQETSQSKAKKQV